MEPLYAYIAMGCGIFAFGYLLGQLFTFNTAPSEPKPLVIEAEPVEEKVDEVFDVLFATLLDEYLEDNITLEEYIKQRATICAQRAAEYPNIPPHMEGLLDGKKI